MISRVLSAQPSVIGADMVTIETDLSRGLYAFSMVGLPDKAVEEARDRISAAIKNSGFESPKSKNHKIIISLAPADLKKEGPLFDLPMALGYLLAAHEIHIESETLRKTLFVGELALDGTIRPIRGTLPIVRAALRAGMSCVVVPEENAREASLVADIDILPAHTVLEVIRHFDTSREDHAPLTPQPHTILEQNTPENMILFEDIKGQENAKRGLLIAAAGRHNTLMVGPPGTGKTMLARAFQSILPPLSLEETLEVTAIHSVAGQTVGNILTHPPFRAPHHTASHTSLVGGGTHPKPGEVTLAHRGVLFMDEFPEFDRRSLDALRQPLEDRVVSISRVQGTAHFPADFILLAAMNPHRGSFDTQGHGAEDMLVSYQKKISGPIMDRIDLWLSVAHISYDDLTPHGRTHTHSDETRRAQEQVKYARERQKERYQSEQKTNASLSARDLETYVPLTTDVAHVLTASAAKLKLSPRGFHRVIKVARTIADLVGAQDIETPHVLEALQYRARH